MDTRSHKNIPCNGDIATMVDLLWKVQVTTPYDMLSRRDRKETGRRCQDENNSSEVPVRKATENDLLNVAGYTRKYKARGVEVRKKTGPGMTIDFSHKKVHTRFALSFRQSCQSSWRK